jgi:ATP-dependent RNA helicase MSS116
MQAVSNSTKNMCYSAFLGFYNSSLRDLKWSKEELVQQGNAYALQVLKTHGVPPIPKKTVGMMGLKYVLGSWRYSFSVS